jgi:hypothetical protein
MLRLWLPCGRRHTCMVWFIAAPRSWLSFTANQQLQ